MSGPTGEEPVPLGTRMLEYYVGLLIEHRNNPDRCRICAIASCETYKHARERLIVSGERVE